MKISIVLGPLQPLPPAGFGAVEKVWVELARAFVRRGHRVTIIGRDDSGDRGMREMQGVRVMSLRGFSASGSILINLLKDFLYALHVVFIVPKSDVIVTNSFWTPVILAPFKRWKGRIIVHVARFPKGQMWLYCGADLLQAVSLVVAEEIGRQCSWLKNRVRILPNPIDITTYHVPELPRRYDGTLTVLYVGRVHPEKGLDLLISAFRLVVNSGQRACLRIIGPVAVAQGGGGKEHLNALMVASQGLPVEFVGPIRDPGILAGEYQKAHCFCYPSLADRGEALPVAPLEAMATGLPVVVSDLRCFQDYVRHDENAVVFDHRAADAPERLAKAICSILSDRDYAARLGRAARTSAERFSHDRIADEYVQMFTGVIHSTGG